jgi:hypothetical protein
LPLDLKIREEEGGRPGIWPEVIESREKIFLEKGERLAELGTGKLDFHLGMCFGCDLGWYYSIH